MTFFDSPQALHNLNENCETKPSLRRGFLTASFSVKSFGAAYWGEKRVRLGTEGKRLVLGKGLNALDRWRKGCEFGSWRLNTGFLEVYHLILSLNLYHRVFPL
jgi:hypothetical protein